MQRRSEQDESSLELLLDTICNVFGGILFIAILVSLLASTRAEQVEKTIEKLRPDIELRAQVRELHRSREAIEQALAHMDGQEALLDQDAGQKNVNILKGLAVQHLRLERDIEQARQWLEAFDGLKLKQLADLDAELSNTAAKLAGAEAELQKQEATTTMTARLHFEHATQKHQIIVLLQNNRIHFVPLGPGRDSVQSAFGEQVTLDSPAQGSWKIHPRANDGFAANAALAAEPEFQRLLASASPSRYFFDIWLYPESVQAYLTLREAAAGAGFEYNVRPLTERPLILGQGGTVSVQ